MEERNEGEKKKKKKEEVEEEEDGLYAISSTIPVLWLSLLVHDIIAWHVTEPLVNTNFLDSTKLIFSSLDNPLLISILDRANPVYQRLVITRPFIREPMKPFQNNQALPV